MFSNKVFALLALVAVIGVANATRQRGCRCNGDSPIEDENQGQQTVRPINRRCPRLCPQIYQPVCASNGRTYGNECELRRAACKLGGIHKVRDGSCRRGQRPQVGRPSVYNSPVEYQQELEQPQQLEQHQQQQPEQLQQEQVHQGEHQQEQQLQGQAHQEHQLQQTKLNQKQEHREVQKEGLGQKESKIVKPVVPVVPEQQQENQQLQQQNNDIKVNVDVNQKQDQKQDQKQKQLE